MLFATVNFARLEQSEDEEYDGTGRNIFATAEKAAVQKTPHEISSDQWHTPSVSATPLISLRFFGFAKTGNSPQKVFILQDGDVFIGTEGDIINRRYKIVHISPGSVAVEDLIDSSPHTLTLRLG